MSPSQAHGLLHSPSISITRWRRRCRSTKKQAWKNKLENKLQNTHNRARTSRRLLGMLCTWYQLGAKGKSWSELQLLLTVPTGMGLGNCWEQGGGQQARVGSSFGLLASLMPWRAPRHPCRAWRCSPAHCSLQKKKLQPLYRSPPSPHMFPLSPPKIKPQPRGVTSWSLISGSKAYLEPICKALTPKIALPCDA